MELTPTVRRTLLAASLGSWLSACPVPALHFQTLYFQRSDVSASGCLLMIQGLLAGWLVLNFAAYANPLLLIAGIQCFRGKLKSARILSIVAMLLAGQTLQLFLFPCTFFPQGIKFFVSPDPAACSYWTTPDVGLFLWVASITLVFLASGRAKVSKIEEQPVVITLFDKA